MTSGGLKKFRWTTKSLRALCQHSTTLPLQRLTPVHAAHFTAQRGYDPCTDLPPPAGNTTTCKHCYKVMGNATLAPHSPEAICSTLGSTGFGTPAIFSRGWDQESCSTVPWFRSTNKAEGVIQPAAYKFSVVGSELKG